VALVVDHPFARPLLIALLENMAPLVVVGDSVRDEDREILQRSRRVMFHPADTNPVRIAHDACALAGVQPAARAPPAPAEVLMSHVSDDVARLEAQRYMNELKKALLTERRAREELQRRLERGVGPAPDEATRKALAAARDEALATLELEPFDEAEARRALARIAELCGRAMR
jgi:hypothetical protein